MLNLELEKEKAKVAPWIMIKILETHLNQTKILLSFELICLVILYTFVLRSTLRDFTQLRREEDI